MLYAMTSSPPIFFIACLTEQSNWSSVQVAISDTCHVAHTTRSLSPDKYDRVTSNLRRHSQCFGFGLLSFAWLCNRRADRWFVFDHRHVPRTNRAVEYFYAFFLALRTLVLALRTVVRLGLGRRSVNFFTSSPTD